MVKLVATLKMDTSAWEVALARAEVLFPKLGKAGAERLEVFLGRVEAGDEAAFVMGKGQPTGVAGEIIVSLKPSPAFLDLIAALEAAHV